MLDKEVHFGGWNSVQSNLTPSNLEMIPFAVTHYTTLHIQYLERRGRICMACSSYTPIQDVHNSSLYFSFKISPNLIILYTCKSPHRMADPSVGSNCIQQIKFKLMSSQDFLKVTQTCPHEINMANNQSPSLCSLLCYPSLEKC